MNSIFDKVDELEINILQKVCNVYYDKLIKYFYENKLINDKELKDVINYYEFLKNNLGNITYFRGNLNPFNFLCNFHKSDCYYDEVLYKYTENAFQSAKYSKEERSKFINITPFNAKKLGRNIKIDVDKWNDERDNIMFNCIKSKYELNPLLQLKLILTGNRIITEGNNWKDKYWGRIVTEPKILDATLYEGENKIGKMHMKLRLEYNLKYINKLLNN